MSWRELCRDTSLDQGDVCRMLRRTVEVLRQVKDFQKKSESIESNVTHYFYCFFFIIFTN